MGMRKRFGQIWDVIFWQKVNFLSKNFAHLDEIDSNWWVHSESQCSTFWTLPTNQAKENRDMRWVGLNINTTDYLEWLVVRPMATVMFCALFCICFEISWKVINFRYECYKSSRCFSACTCFCCIPFISLFLIKLFIVLGRPIFYWQRCLAPLQLPTKLFLYLKDSYFYFRDTTDNAGRELMEGLCNFCIGDTCDGIAL